MLANFLLKNFLNPTEFVAIGRVLDEEREKVCSGDYRLGMAKSLETVFTMIVSQSAATLSTEWQVMVGHMNNDIVYAHASRLGVVDHVVGTLATFGKVI